MRGLWIVVVIVCALALPALTLAQSDDICSREAVIAAFVAAEDITVWSAQYVGCPPHVQRAVGALAAGYAMLGSEYLPFNALNTTGDFNVIWKWYQGSSGGLIHFVDAVANTISIISDSNTQLRDSVATAPVLAYPIVDDSYVAQVKVFFAVLGEMHGAGLGVRSAQDLNDWVRIARVGGSIEVVATDNGVTTSLELIPFDSTELDVYLRIERALNQFTFSYSLNGEDWFAVVSNYEQAITADSEVFLNTYFAEAGIAQTIFSEMSVE